MHMAAIYEQSDSALTLLPRIPASSSYLFLPDFWKQTKLAPSQMRYATIHCILPQGNVSGWECLPNSIYISLNRAGDKSWWKKPESYSQKKATNMGLSSPAMWLLPICYSSKLQQASLTAQLVKESACKVGDRGLIPGWRRSPGEGNGNPLQYSCLENPMDRGPWQGTVYGITRVRHNLAIKLQQF